MHQANVTSRKGGLQARRWLTKGPLENLSTAQQARRRWVRLRA
jgi:hypothetical protein